MSQFLFYFIFSIVLLGYVPDGKYKCMELYLPWRASILHRVFNSYMTAVPAWSNPSAINGITWVV